jgi:acetyl-CoA synthetase
VPRGRRRRLAGREARHVVKALVVLAEGYSPSDELAAEIQGFVRRLRLPRRIAFVDDLPKTLAGKIRRIELREAEREGSAQAAS